MYKFFLCLRYLRKRRIAFFAVAAVCLCVAMVLIVFSVMDGFLQMVKDRSRGMLGDLIVDNGTWQGFPFYEEFIDELELDPALGPLVHKATPVIITYGVLRFPETQVTKQAQIVGIRLNEICEVNDFKKGLFYEQYYPGTTTFDEQKEPRYGLNDQGDFVLPEELEVARKEWASRASPEEIREAWRFRLWLFSLKDTGYSRVLNKRRMPDGLRSQLAEYGIALPPSAEIAVVMKSTAWRIDLPGDSYLLRYERTPKGDEIHVFHGQYKGPGFYMPVPYDVQRASDSNGQRMAPAWIGNPLPGAILGTDTCAVRMRSGEYERRYWRGDKVELVMVPMSDTGKISDATGAERGTFRYVDDCRTGVYQIDSMSVYVEFERLQEILRMGEIELVDQEGTIPARASQIQMKLAVGVDPMVAKNLVQQKWKAFSLPRLATVRTPALLTEVRVQTWEEKQADFIGAVEKEKILMTILFCIISVVAVFLVGCIFYMIVQQKTRDIGIVKSVGATSWGVANIFISYGAAVGVFGGAVGVLVGTLFVRYINEIQDLLMSIHPELQVWNPEIYTFDHIPNKVDPGIAVIIYLIAIGASMLGSLVAAYRAARVWPVEALRYE